MPKRKVPTEIYSRVVGYYRPVSQWNKGKVAEFKERKLGCVQSILNEVLKSEPLSA